MSRANIRTALIQGVIDTATGYPTKWPNAPFRVPNDAPWLRATIIDMNDSVRTLGSGGRNRIDGLLQLDVFVPKNSGDVVLMGIVDQLGAIFQSGKELTHNGQVVRINSASNREGMDEETWYRRIIEVDFYSFETRGI